MQAQTKQILAASALAARLSVWTAPAAQAQVIISGTIVAPGVVVHIGDVDPRGYYWDGRYWRDPHWWDLYGRGRLVHYGDRDDRGWRWDGDHWREPAWWAHHDGEREYARVPPGHRDWDDRDRHDDHGRGRD